MVVDRSRDLIPYLTRMARRYQIVDTHHIPVARSVSSKKKAKQIAMETGTKKNPSCIVIHYGSGMGPFQTRVTRECYANGKRVTKR